MSRHRIRHGGPATWRADLQRSDGRAPWSATATRSCMGRAGPAGGRSRRAGRGTGATRRDCGLSRSMTAALLGRLPPGWVRHLTSDHACRPIAEPTSTSWSAHSGHQVTRSLTDPALQPDPAGACSRRPAGDEVRRGGTPASRIRGYDSTRMMRLVWERDGALRRGICRAEIQPAGWRWPAPMGRLVGRGWMNPAGLVGPDRNDAPEGTTVIRAYGGRDPAAVRIQHPSEGRWSWRRLGGPGNQCAALAIDQPAPAARGG